MINQDRPPSRFVIRHKASRDSQMGSNLNVSVLIQLTRLAMPAIVPGRHTGHARFNRHEYSHAADRGKENPNERDGDPKVEKGLGEDVVAEEHG